MRKTNKLREKKGMKRMINHTFVTNHTFVKIKLTDQNLIQI
jgi:hypothetical protein